MRTSLFIIFVMLTGALLSQNQFSQLDSLFTELEQKGKGMGSIAISQNNKVVYARAIGFSDRKNQKTSDVNTKYRVGSLSKTYTAVVILKLIEEKKLKLNTKLAKYYPDFPDAKKITIEHLLSHRSGLFNFTNNPGYFSYHHLPQTKDEMLKKLKAGPQQFKPGQEFQYSNTNYVLLTYIAEDVTGKDFSDLIDLYIVEPLKLNRTSYGGTTDVNENEALSYNNLGGWYQEKITDMSVPEGAGGMETTPTEVNVFLNALFNNQLLDKKTMLKMTSIKDSSNYGLGVYQIPVDSIFMLGHTGGVDGFQTFGFYNDSLKLNITYISNATSYPAWDIFQDAVINALNKSFDYPQITKEEAPEEGAIEDFIGVYKTNAFPLDITVTVKENKLYAQATGQSAFPLEKIGLNLFEYAAAGIKMLFNQKNNTMGLVQQGVRVDFERE